MKTQIINKNSYTRNQHPGKFEGENAATEYFWEAFGDGETIYAAYFDTDGKKYSDEQWDNQPIAELFRINADEAEAFDLPIGHVFMLREDSQGFVLGSVHRSRDEAETAFRNWLGL